MNSRTPTKYPEINSPGDLLPPGTPRQVRRAPMPNSISPINFSANSDVQSILFVKNSSDEKYTNVSFASLTGVSLTTSRFLPEVASSEV